MVAVTARPALSAAHVRVCVYVALWFVANGTTILFNKYIFQVLGFRCPLTLTLLHMAMQSVLAMATIDQLALVERVHVERRDVVRKLLPISVAFCANICLGNVSLRYVPVSFMQTIKASTPVAAAVVQYLHSGARLTRPALASLAPITGGLAIASLTELEFHMGGFVAALVSCVLTATKFVLSSQMLGGRYKLDAINMLYYMAPPSVVMLLPFSFLIERGTVAEWMSAPERVSSDYALLVLSAVVSFSLNAALFMVLKATSSITVTVAGNVKTVIVILVSIWIYQNPVTPLNLVGCIAVVAGCLWYGLIKDKWVVAPHETYDTVAQSAGSVDGPPPRSSPRKDTSAGIAIDAR